ncbi:MAG: FG-GAP repeat protein [Deltaproteobacteria bacterium]|nr:FG-GAP repeat protein [Deltaproteobacteria bacterium]
MRGFRLFLFCLTGLLIGVGLGSLDAQNSTPIKDFVFQSKLSVEDGAAYDTFGFEIAINQNQLWVGAPRLGQGEAGLGSVYVFSYQDGAWVKTQKLVAMDGEASDYFGDSIFIHENIALVGAPKAKIGGAADQGAVYVFTYQQGAWSQTQKLIALDGAAGDRLGNFVFTDGHTIMIGSPLADVGGNTDQGAVYVFAYQQGAWSQTQKLTVLDGAAGDQLGSSVKIHSKTALISAFTADVEGRVDRGATYVFNENNGMWVQSQKLVAVDGLDGDRFGRVMQWDGTTALLSAYFADVGGNKKQGAVYLFTYQNGNWVQTQRLVAVDGAAGDLFGVRAMMKDNLILVSAPFADMNSNVNQGAVYVYSNQTGIWAQMQKITASDGNYNDRFGGGLALEGFNLLVGAYFADINGHQDQGAVYSMVMPVTQTPVLDPIGGGEDKPPAGSGETGGTGGIKGKSADSKEQVDEPPTSFQGSVGCALRVK